MTEKKMEHVVQRLKLEFEERKKIEKKLKQRLTFEKTVSTVSSRFIAVKNINTAINSTLRDIGRLSGASRAYIFFFSKDGKTMSNTHEWCRKGVPPQKQSLQNIPSNSLPWWVAQLRKGNTIHITDVSKMPRTAKATKKMLESQDIKSLLVIPVSTGGKLVGFAGFDDVAKAGEWDDDDLMLLRICSEIIGKALESKRANDKLKESEEQLRIFFNTAKDAIFISDKTGRFIDVNKAACKALRYSKPELLKLSNKDIDTDSRGFNEFKQIRDGKIKESKFEMKQRRKDGTYHHVEIVGSSFKSRGQQVFQAIARDMTERKKAEAQIRESEKQFRVLAEENPSMIYIHDFKGIVYANQRAVDVMGYTCDEGCSKNFDFMKLVAPEFRPNIRKFVIKNMAGKEIEPFECVLVTRKGKRIDVIITTKLIQYRGKPAALGMVTDITGRKKEEAKIKGYARELETKVKERTKELSAKIDDLEKFHDLAVGRELKMIELKGQIKKLQKKLDEKKHD